MFPSFILPKKYEYSRKVDPTILSEQDCVICMSSIEDDNYLITPCNHFFHVECLNRWMEEKMECKKN